MTTDINNIEAEMNKSEFRKSILLFSGPIVAELMLMSLISIVNLSMVGHLGAYAISAIGLTSQPVFISVAVFQSFNVGATALVARFIGARENENAKKVVVQTMMMAVLSGIILAFISFLYSKEIVVLMGAKADTVEPAAMYMRYMSIGMLFQAIPTAVASILRGAGESKAPMQFNVVSNIVNAAGGYMLIYGFWIFPELGLEGAAIAATLAKLVACGMSIYALFTCGLPVAISFKDQLRLDGVMLKRIMRIGISAAGEQLAVRIGFLLYTKMIADLGTTAFAAHQVCLGITGLASNAVMGFSTAASSYTGRSLGAKRPDLAEKYCDEIRRMGFVLSITIGTAFFFFGYQISRLFTPDASVLAMAALVLKIAAFITPPQNSLMIISGSLRGAGDTKWPLVNALVGTIFTRLTLAYILVKYFHLGIAGAWTAALIDQSIRSVLMLYRYKNGGWKQLAV
ncbi:MAG: MATE family efflux transporter [Clostridia bacterium]|nr:MATE family efflux transporter [Clostridia bacterium]